MIHFYLIKMGADLHIHVFEKITEEDLGIFFKDTLGSKYFRGLFAPRKIYSHEQWEESFSKIADTPNIWIGEVSWLKAGITGDSETFVPNSVQAVAEIIGESLPILDEELKEKILKAMNLPNATTYRTTKKPEVVDFLEKHIGKKLFTVSW